MTKFNRQDMLQASDSGPTPLESHTLERSILSDNRQSLLLEIKSFRFINKENGFFIASNSTLGTCNREMVLSDKNVFKTEKQARKALAYSQSTQLMALQCYNGDWKPDWNDGEEKYIIVRYGDNIVKDTIYRIYREISFRTEESRDAFFSNHMDLLRTYFELD